MTNEYQKNFKWRLQEIKTERKVEEQRGRKGGNKEEDAYGVREKEEKSNRMKYRIRVRKRKCSLAIRHF